MSRTSTWWETRPRGQRVVVAVVVAIVAVVVIRQSIDRIVGATPGGPVSSSYSTGGDGLEGYADLLRADGRRVRRQRDRPGPADLPVDATVVVADPDELDPASARALAEFVTGGGRLVLTGPASGAVLAGLTGTDVHVEDRGVGRSTAVWVPTADTGGARRLAGDRSDRWASVGPLQPLAGDAGGPVIVTAPVGSGRVVAVADPSLLQNRNLGQADNAALGLGLAGDASRPVVFVESIHGFGATGTAALPDTWTPAFVVLALAVATGLWSFGRRFGPPEPAERELRPPRRDHVEAVAATLDAVGADTVPTHDRPPGGQP